MLTLTLPMPPSANSAFTNRRFGKGYGRIKSKAYKDWIANADAYYLLQKLGRQKPIEGKYHVTIFMPEDMRGDEDGRVKLAIDWLVKRNLTPDDKHMRGHEVKRDSELHGHIWMIVRALEEMESDRVRSQVQDEAQAPTDQTASALRNTSTADGG